MYFQTLKSEECYGCRACEQICHLNIIQMKFDEEGFLYPVKDIEKCTNCGLCEKVCPHVAPLVANDATPKVYATYLLDSAERQRSSSGGLFFAIANWIINNDGIVFGASFDSNFRLRHIGVECLSDLHLLRGSKYLQSNLENVYSQIKSSLKNKRWVYFVGTPCQIAGLKSFLRKEYETLVTSDLVCHGVPSQLLFDKHLAYLEKKEQKAIIGYEFRDNRAWRVCESVIYKDKSGKIRKQLPTYDFSPYLYSFMRAYTYRISCYECKFSRIPRQGDITLADYWGIHTFIPNIDTSKGVSLVLVNTEKGNLVWEKICSNCKYVHSNIIDAAKYNRNLVTNTEKPSIRRTIYKRINNEGYDKIAETEFRISHWKIRYFLRQIYDSKYMRLIKKHIKIRK